MLHVTNHYPGTGYPVDMFRKLDRDPGTNRWIAMHRTISVYPTIVSDEQSCPRHLEHHVKRFRPGYVTPYDYFRYGSRD